MKKFWIVSFAVFLLIIVTGLILVKSGVFAEKEQTELIIACNSQNLEWVKKLLDKGANPNQRDYQGITPLEAGCRPGASNAIVELLLSKGADANAKTSYGQPLLMEFCDFQNDKENLRIIKSLLAHGADINARGNSGNTALVMAVMIKNIEAIKLLLSKGANNNIANIYGVTPLMVAAYYGQPDVVKMLLSSGADVIQKDAHDWSALDIVGIRALGEEIAMADAKAHSKDKNFATGKKLYKPAGEKIKELLLSVIGKKQGVQ